MGDFVHGPQADLKLASEHHLQEKDMEKDIETGYDSHHQAPAYADSETAEIVRARELHQKVGFLRTLRNGEAWLDKKMGIETQGIDRIHEEDKKPPSLLNVFFLWWSLTCHVGTLPIGILGPEFGLSLHASVACIIVGTMLGALCTSYTGTLGPKLGLRAIASSRYSFGFYGAKLCSVLNVLVGGGFAVVNVVVVGQILSAVSNYTMPIEVGCVIIAVISYVVSIFGFAIIHTYEKYSWIATFIIMCILIGQIADKVDPSVPSEAIPGLPFGGLAYAGTWLSFMSINFSSASGWCSIASDYYCNYPAKTKSWKIFALTFFGICIPTIFVTSIGACLGNAALSPNFNLPITIDGEPGFDNLNPVLYESYEDHKLGGLLLNAFHPMGFSKFLLVLLTFSVIGNNVAVNYSSGLSLQLLGHYFHAIPRFVWSFANALVVAVLAIAGREHLSTIVNNFVSLLGYWTVSFTIILLLEDKVFRRRSGYNLNAWDQPRLLPWGAAAILALLTGYLAGGVTGMAQTWYVGPIAIKFGPYGGDVGIYLSAAFTLLVYPIARYFEMKKTGR